MIFHTCGIKKNGKEKAVLMEIRKVNATDDFNALSRIYALSWKAAYIGIVPQQYLDELAEDHWADTLQNSSYDSYVLIENGKYIGTS